MEKTIKHLKNISSKPEFLRAKTRQSPASIQLRRELRRRGLNTVCEQAHCPNLGECFGKKTATFMILGKVCTRGCRFCAVKKGIPESVDLKEPTHIAEMAKALGLKHIVITSVTRDDLSDGGAEQFYQTVLELRKVLPEATIEVLTPDFQGKISSLERVIEAQPQVFNHNLETVLRLYPEVRPGADYKRSLSLLKWVSEKAKEIKTKSGIMLGMGETKAEIKHLFQDLREVGCEVLTLGQYLAPSRTHWPVKKYYQPEEYEELKELGMELGFKQVFAGPLVRSSYCAEEIFQRLSERNCPTG